MADQPLSPATDRGLGEPLPHQLPNRTRAHLRPGLLPFISSRCQEVTLCGISNGFPLLFHCLRQITHVLLTRPPLAHRRFSTNTVSICEPVRLACVKHAASVHPEPGSNSQILYLRALSSSFLVRFSGLFVRFVFSKTNQGSFVLTVQFSRSVRPPTGKTLD